MEPGKVDPRNESLKYAWERDKTTLFSNSDLPIPWDLTIASASLLQETRAIWTHRRGADLSKCSLPK